MNRQRRDQVRRNTLDYLGNLLCEITARDGELYENPDGSPLTDEEVGYAMALAEREGMRLIARAKRAKP